MEHWSGPQKNPQKNIENIWELCLGCVLDCSSSPSPERSDLNFGKKSGTTRVSSQPFRNSKGYSSEVCTRAKGASSCDDSKLPVDAGYITRVNKHKMYSPGLFRMGRHSTGTNMWRHIVVCHWKKEHTGSHIPGCAAYLDTLWDGLIGWQSFKGKPGALSGKSLPFSLWYKGLNSGELWVTSLFSQFFFTL